MHDASVITHYHIAVHRLSRLLVLPNPLNCRASADGLGRSVSILYSIYLLRVPTYI